MTLTESVCPALRENERQKFLEISASRVEPRSYVPCIACVCDVGDFFMRDRQRAERAGKIRCLRFASLLSAQNENRKQRHDRHAQGQISGDNTAEKR